MRIIDISPAVDSDAVVWPGDVAYSLTPNWSIASGDTITVHTVQSTAHVGAHIDAPSHIIDGEPSIVNTPLDACVGDCVVVDVSDLVDAQTNPRGYAPAAAVRARLAERLADSAHGSHRTIERLVLRHAPAGETRNPKWDADVPGVDPELMEWFGSQGGRLVGIDLVSFDPTASTALLAHKAGIAHGIVLLEGLDLSAAPEGDAELIALPLSWHGADASPVRAVLRID